MVEFEQPVFKQASRREGVSSRHILQEDWAKFGKFWFKPGRLSTVVKPSNGNNHHLTHSHQHHHHCHHHHCHHQLRINQWRSKMVLGRPHLLFAAGLIVLLHQDVIFCRSEEGFVLEQPSFTDEVRWFWGFYAYVCVFCCCCCSATHVSFLDCNVFRQNTHTHTQRCCKKSSSMLE